MLACMLLSFFITNVNQRRKKIKSNKKYKVITFNRKEDKTNGKNVL